MRDLVLISPIVIVLPMLPIYQKKKRVLKTWSFKLLQAVVSGSSALEIRQKTSPSESALIS